MTFIEAIARMEGFYAQGDTQNRPQRNCNPGDIEFGEFSRLHGSTHGDPRFAVFPTPDMGFAALRALLNKRYIGMTVSDAINKYAPPVENSTNQYIALVCEWSELTPNTVLTEENIG